MQNFGQSHSAFVLYASTIQYTHSTNVRNTNICTQEDKLCKISNWTMAENINLLFTTHIHTNVNMCVVYVYLLLCCDAMRRAPTYKYIYCVYCASLFLSVCSPCHFAYNALVYLYDLYLSYTIASPLYTICTYPICLRRIYK